MTASRKPRSANTRHTDCPTTLRLSHLPLYHTSYDPGKASGGRRHRWRCSVYCTRRHVPSREPALRRARFRRARRRERAGDARRRVLGAVLVVVFPRNQLSQVGFGFLAAGVVVAAHVNTSAAESSSTGVEGA